VASPGSRPRARPRSGLCGSPPAEGRVSRPETWSKTGLPVTLSRGAPPFPGRSSPPAGRDRFRTTTSPAPGTGGRDPPPRREVGPPRADHPLAPRAVGRPRLPGRRSARASPRSGEARERGPARSGGAPFPVISDQLATPKPVALRWWFPVPSGSRAGRGSGSRPGAGQAGGTPAQPLRPPAPG